MIKSADFWDKEKKAPLMNLNFDYLKAELNDEVFKKTVQWPSLLLLNDVGSTVVESKNIEIIQNPSSSSAENRVLLHDAERTFLGEENRKKLFRILATLKDKFGDYAQGLSYAASFLLLTLDENTALNILIQLNENKNYIPGYWKAQAVAFSTDAYVFNELMQLHFPIVHKHLQDHTIMPDTYCQKWFVGLCLHVLPFEALFEFWEQFLQGGYKFLQCFGLSLIKQMQSQILQSKDHSTLFGLLRFDQKFIKTDDFQKLALQIVHGAKDFNVDDIKFDEWRETLFEKYVKPRLVKAQVVDDEDEITDYSTTDDEEDDKEEDK